MQLINCYSDFRNVDAFLRYSRSKSKVVKNRAEFWTFFPLELCRGQKLYTTCYHDCLAAHRLTNSKVIGYSLEILKRNK